MEKISAWMDGELGGQDCAQLVRHGANPAQREAWECYHLIGEALRGELDDAQSCGVGTNSALTRKICAALQDEPNVLVPAAARAAKVGMAQAGAEGKGEYVRVANGAPVWRPWLMAASVATAAVVGWQAVTSDWRRESGATQVAAAATQSKPMKAPSNGAMAIPTQSAAISYDRYLQAHDEAAPTTRLSGARVYIQPASYVLTH
jgi:sigma-E factor negative regulatory protein RseA